MNGMELETLRKQAMLTSTVRLPKSMQEKISVIARDRGQRVAAYMERKFGRSIDADYARIMKKRERAKHA